VKLPSTQTPIRRLLADGDERTDRSRLTYVRSFLLLRVLVGALGIALPVVLVCGDRWLRGEWALRASLSAYYHTGVRDVFVGVLCTIAAFLLTYMAFHYVWDNVLSIVAGLAALGVALCPTAGPEPLTPVQEKFGTDDVSLVHLICAVTFILSLAAISFLFGYREGRRPEATRVRRVWWRCVHWLCGGVIVLAVGYVGLTTSLDWHDEHSVLYGEAVAAFAFGVSWLTKGTELRLLFGADRPVRLDESTEALVPEPV
jgi:hypothetical protein